MRAHRLALAARQFAEVKLIGPAEPKGLWPALPPERWIQGVPEKRFPRFHDSLISLVQQADGDVLIACKPMLASFGAALIASESRGDVPVILDLDDLDIAFTPREMWREDPSITDLRRPASAVYVSLLTKAAPAASAITVASSHLKKRFGGTLIHHGAPIEMFDPARIDRQAARKQFGFDKPTVLFAGTPRWHKGLKPLAKAVRRIPEAELAVLCRPEDLAEAEWKEFPIKRLPMARYSIMPSVLAAADVVAIPQLDTKTARYQMPIKVYDCMAAGAAIVATAVSDMPLVLEDAARIVPAGESRALRHAIRDLLRNPEEGRALGAKARARCIERYSMEKVAEALEAVVRKVAAKA